MAGLVKQCNRSRRVPCAKARSFMPNCKTLTSFRKTSAGHAKRVRHLPEVAWNTAEGSVAESLSAAGNPFEADPVAIVAAAEQPIAYVRTYQLGGM